MNKLEKIEREAQKALEKIAEMQTLLKGIETQRTELENLQIIQQIRALKLTRDELYAFLSDGKLPASLQDASAGAPEPETIYSRWGKKRSAEQGAATSEEKQEPPDEAAETPTNESEGMNDEE